MQLEVLHKIDQKVELVGADGAIGERLLDGALIQDTADGVGLTTAGIELCKSLQQRGAADAQAKKIRKQQEQSSLTGTAQPALAAPAG
ncbi:MAG TPA: hypothetical protein VNI56_00470 [Xanthomonadaceae bacterium]|nr:hypothetical protein [Xanthomonadaceae bacterium]